ncbi:uncharacterized protein RCO7_14465 [Rhynchosporium graminicola]|uniref:Uncharacterized protein n=1 Tax=Rhynchosporium graminicola TaxID=2792576 RepID=A0A1E1KJE2_9HELO|nr:uncharacterized protein RCO7_14465 [Rhynchosporium commune]
MNTGVAGKDAREVIWGWASTSKVSTRWHYFRPSQEGTALSRAQHASRGKTIQKEGSQAEPNGRPATDEEEKGLIRRRWNKRTGHAILNDEAFEARSGGAARSWDGKFCLLLHLWRARMSTAVLAWEISVSILKSKLLKDVRNTIHTHSLT